MPATYVGREQAFIKHELLKSYLEKLFHIVGLGARRLGVKELCYVDCFAGPWSDESEDLGGTSIAISLAMLEKCRAKLGELGVTPKFRSLYVEKSQRAFARLEAFLSKRHESEIRAEPRHGDFADLRQEILRWCGDDAFVFFFIDPKGWADVGVDILEPLLRREKSEFLINFQYNFINRTASMDEWRNEIKQLLGEAVDPAGMEPSERERRLVNTYRRNLMLKMPATVAFPARSAYVRVIDPSKDRPKYHLVYLTCHPRGVVEFMEISETVALIQKQVRASKRDEARARKSGMEDLFGAESLIDREEGHVGPDEVDRYWREYLAGGVKVLGEAEFASILERTNWFPGDLQSSLLRLMDAGLVQNLDAARRRPKKPLHWDKAERLQLLERPR
ncbi:MAG TPA: three-Cys-motif partner protein TcmP [Burkholderiales bacterium]|nr:three-Cys-motif partner protein TcmP [Burkholderiales bacterium]